MIDSYFQRAVPASVLGTGHEADDEDVALKQNLDSRADSARRCYERWDFSGAVQDIWQMISLVDFYLVTQKPWKRASDPAELPMVGNVLYNAAEALRMVVVLAHPVIPDATQMIWKHLGQSGDLATVQIERVKWGELRPGTQIGKPEAVYPRVDKKEASEKIEAMENEIRNPSITPAAPAAAPALAVNAKITIEDFAKVELKVGVVKSAERIQGADKLLKIMVDIGDEVRQVLAGIALAYAPEDLVGRKVVVVTNLAPRKMRGQESNGMLLAASAGPDGKPVLCTFAEDIPPGAKVR